MDSGNEFAIPVVVLSEFLFGIQIVPRAKANKIEWGRLQESFGYYAIDRQDAEEAANLQISMRRRGRQVATIDALITTIAIRYELTLLTTDRDFEFIPHLQQENWLLSHS
jgi:tRNA(fMet)-specific endonuclease VapC